MRSGWTVERESLNRKRPTPPPGEAGSVRARRLRFSDSLHQTTAPSAAHPKDQSLMPLLYAATLLLSAAVCRAAAVRQDGVASLGRHAQRVEHLHGLLPAALLAGYVYAHLTIRWLGPRRQAALHLAVLCLPWLVLPFGLSASWIPPADANPTAWLLALLAVSVGLPFFVVSASAPMLQAWFAASGHRAGKDPYFLYAASNLGSLGALLAYPDPPRTASAAGNPVVGLGGRLRVARRAHRDLCRGTLAIESCGAGVPPDG